MKIPQVIAHRGSSQEAPENTLPAFEKAIEEGADGVELDLWMCGSGELVVTHDRNTLRQTGVDGDLTKMNFDELRRLDFGAFQGDRFAGEKIPTLSEVLDLTKGLSLINIEVKGKNLRSHGLEEKLHRTLLDFRLFNQVVVSSFNPAPLFRLNGLNPRVRIGLLFRKKSILPLRRGWPASFIKPFSIHPEVSLLTDRLLKRAEKKNQKVIAWTVNNIEYLEWCFQKGVDGVITDHPAWSRDLFREWSEQKKR